MKIKFALIVCLAASTMVGCALHRGVFQTPAAQALEPSERAVMEQPGWTPFGNYYVVLQEAGCRSDDKWYRAWPGLVEPGRIEVAPGEHSFNFMGIHSWDSFHINLTMLPGHIYKPVGVTHGDTWATSWLKLTDTAPDGKFSEIMIRL